MKGVRIPFVWSPLLALIVILSLILPALPATPALAREAVGPLEGRDPVAVSASPGVLPAADPARIAAALGELPLYFIENRGQVEWPVAYYAQGRESAIYFTPGGVTFALSASAQRWAVKLDFLDANGDVKPAGQDETEAIVSYFKGRPDEWETGLPTYAQVAYRDLWPSIDLVYLGRANELKYEFRVRPGADPARIRLAYRGAEQVSLTAGGALRVDTPAGSLTDTAPVAYQEVDDRQVPVRAAFELSGSEYGFALGAYDPSRPLVFDPSIVVYCGYIGGTSYDRGYGIAVDSAGCAYVTGYTTSSEASFPVAGGPYLSHNGTLDAFVAKVAADGASLAYCGYIGGAGEDIGYGVAVDGAGCAYVTGYTTSSETSFPVAGGPGLIHNGSNDVFVAKVAADGTSLVYCGYIGGAGSDYGNGIAVDGAGCAYVAGQTTSSEASFPVAGGPDLGHNGLVDAFVAKVAANGANLLYCGYIGGSGADAGNGIAVNNAGYAYVTGYTESSEASFPETGGPDLEHNGGDDAFVAKVAANGASLVYCGYIGGASSDYGKGVAVNSAGHAYVTGYTYSSEDSFPVTDGPDLSHNGGTYDAFVARVTASGASLVYCGYIGGSDSDYGSGVAVDGAGRAYVTGYTKSSEASFPITVGPDLSHNGSYDAFAARVVANGTSLVYCGYIGGAGTDYGQGIAVDDDGSAYVAGYTESSEASFPITVGPDLMYNDAGDAFVAKIEAEETVYLPFTLK